MAKFQFLNLRERADALRRGGVDWAMDLHDALDAVDDLAAADEALEEIGEVVGLTLPDTSDPERIVTAVQNYCSNLAKERDAANAEAKRLNGVIEALQAEQGRLVAFMIARGLVPPPPPAVTRPAVPERRPYGVPRPTLRQQWQPDVEDDDVPF